MNLGNPDGCFTLHGTTPYLGKTTEIQKQITGGVYFNNQEEMIGIKYVSSI